MLLETGTNFTILDTEVAFFFLCHGVHMLLDCPEAIAFNFVLLLGHMLLPEKKVHPTFQCSQFVSAINTLQIVVVIPFQFLCVWLIVSMLVTFQAIIYPPKTLPSCLILIT